MSVCNGLFSHLYADAAESGKVKVHEEERMQKMWEYKRIGKSMVCLLAAGALTFSNINIVMAADPQAVAEKTEDEKAPKGIF